MAIPILYVFRGWQPYLELSVQQARRFNPEARILHITQSNSRIASGAEGVFDEDLFEMANRLEKVYRHMSVNPASFELFCLQRWMVTYAAMCKLNLDQAILMDGDVLLWADMTPIFEGYAQYGMSWTEPDQPGTVFVSDREVLRHLCESILWHYETAEGMKRLETEYLERKATGLPAAITDMSLLSYFRADNPGLVGDNGQIFQGGRFDHNMMESDGFQVHCGLKRFVWKDGLPYGQDVTNGDLVRFFSMHFVGRAKGYMNLYAQGKNLSTGGKIRSAPQWVRARIPAAIRRAKHLLSVR